MIIAQGPWNIDDLLTFGVTTHRFDTGTLTDADAVPAYRVYEDETGTAILTGNMAKLDDANTTGLYSEQITLSAANGFEVGKTYTVYVTATVNSVVGGDNGAFKVVAPYALASALVTVSGKIDTIDDFLDTEVASILAAVDTEVAAIKTVTDQLVAAHAEPAGVPAANETPLDKIGYVFMALRNRLDVTATKKQFYNDGGTVEWEKDLSDNGTTYTETEANAP